MSKILLLEYNVVALKADLRSIFPHIKSAHMSEAIAVAFGFRTNSSLRAELSKSQKPKIRLVEFSYSRFQDWLSDKGYKADRKIPSLCFEKVDIPIWIMSKSKILIDHCFWNARTHNIPMVHINKRTKYADVHWDYISVDEIHEPQKFNVEDLNRLAALVRKYNGKFGAVGISVFTGTIYRLKIEDAKLVADEVFCILHNLISPDAA
jgi:hypothetical protein